ncbi:ATP-dependent DNA helicase [Pyronema domesticum]|nr:ATP-dependent DNA helicase [Pyronema domesticum]
METSLRTVSTESQHPLSLGKAEHWGWISKLYKDQPDEQGSDKLNEPDISEKEPLITPRDFYLSLHVPEKTDESLDSMQHKDISCSLFPFQRRTVKWMLGREGILPTGIGERNNSGQDFRDIGDQNAPCVPPTFFRVHNSGSLDSNNFTYVSHVLKVLSNELPRLLDANSLTAPKNTGILAEEMGLGKTIELMSLVCLHRRDPSTIGEIVYDAYQEKEVKVSGATLIITPPSILNQWKSELAARAPSLKVVFIYDGIRRIPDDGAAGMVDVLLGYDVVLTTYNVLSEEIHYTTQRSHNLRTAKIYEPKESPLIKISWWRVCLDEAQMVDTGVSKAATVARVIPRVNAWCLTGTPVRKDIDDCFGLLLFLRYEPFCQKAIWKNLTRHPCYFKSLFNTIGIRHSKDIVQDEISLPPQNRVVVTVPFSQVEEQNYTHLFDLMCRDVQVKSDGSPLVDDWNLDDVADKMREWLIRLRQTCLHPEAGERNRKIFGRVGGPLRTVEQVLEAMIENVSNDTQAKERSLFWSMVHRGQLLLEHKEKAQDAMNTWQEALKDVAMAVEEGRQALESEIANAERLKKASKKATNGDSDPKESNLEEDISSEKKTGFSPSVNGAKLRLRTLLEIQHACYYWIATAYFQLKEAAEKQGDNELIIEYTAKEAEFYELAKGARLEMMNETRSNAIRVMNRLSEKKETQSFVEIPDFDPPGEQSGGIESQTILNNIATLADALNNQVILFDEWREILIGLSLEPLVDDDSEEIKGDELEVSVEKQEEGYAYMSAIRALLADREEALTEVHNMLIEQDTRTAMNRPSKIHLSLFTELMAAKDKVNPLNEYKSMKRLMNDLRMLISSFKSAEEDGSKRAQLERALAESEYKRLQNIVTIQTRAVHDSFREVELFRSISNTRMEFYRQFQIVSDTLLPINLHAEYNTSHVTDGLIEGILKKEDKFRNLISQGKSKQRYLSHLSSIKIEDKPSCMICMDNYEIGIISNCGHSFCKECIMIWRKTSTACPSCKTHLLPGSFFEVTYKPQSAVMEREPQANENTSKTPTAVSRKVYENIKEKMLDEIKAIDLESSYGSKIDMMTRHLVWLKRNEPGFKAVIFSQWSEVLDAVKTAIKAAGIQYAGLYNSRDKKVNGVEAFKNNPEISCFFLHAKSQSSGLTVVNATHVFLCEPLLNVGLELQAVSRVHRIGQKNMTTVWCYVVDGTVEQSVLNLATRRRLALVGQVEDGEEQKVIHQKLLAAEAEELREGLSTMVEKWPGGGEMVKNEDLWDCLFSSSNKVLSNKKAGNGVVSGVDRELRAHAAEMRVAQEALEALEAEDEMMQE